MCWRRGIGGGEEVGEPGDVFLFKARKRGDKLTDHAEWIVTTRV